MLLHEEIVEVPAGVRECGHLKMRVSADNVGSDIVFAIDFYWESSVSNSVKEAEHSFSHACGAIGAEGTALSSSECVSDMVCNDSWEQQIKRTAMGMYSECSSQDQQLQIRSLNSPSAGPEGPCDLRKCTNTIARESDIRWVTLPISTAPLLLTCSDKPEGKEADQGGQEESSIPSCNPDLGEGCMGDDLADGNITPVTLMERDVACCESNGGNLITVSPQENCSIIGSIHELPPQPHTSDGLTFTETMLICDSITRGEFCLCGAQSVLTGAATPVPIILPGCLVPATFAQTFDTSKDAVCLPCTQDPRMLPALV